MSTLESDVENLLKEFLRKHRGIRLSVLRTPEGIRLMNQAPIQSSVFGRNKYFKGRETVWLVLQLPRRPRIDLARLSETTDGLEFKVLALHDHETKVGQAIAKLKNR